MFSSASNFIRTRRVGSGERENRFVSREGCRVTERFTNRVAGEMRVFFYNVFFGQTPAQQFENVLDGYPSSRDDWLSPITRGSIEIEEIPIISSRPLGMAAFLTASSASDLA